MTNISDKTKGLWPSILRALGLEESYLTRKNGPCPFCGGKDRWRYVDRKGDGFWVCNQCGTGTGFMLAQRLLGLAGGETAKRIEQILGELTMAPKVVVREPPDIKRLWIGAKQIDDKCPAHKYLTKRVGPAYPRSELRWSNRMWYQEGEFMPALLALVRDSAGRPINVQKTYLTNEGDKAPVSTPKKFLAGALPSGSAVRLAPAGETLGVAEGVETALSAMLLWQNVFPVWAALSANNLRKFFPPEGVKKVMIFSDNDENYTGQAASYHLANVLTLKGYEVKVNLPPTKDWNDYWETVRKKTM